jgi:hypothetical protein
VNDVPQRAGTSTRACCPGGILTTSVTTFVTESIVQVLANDADGRTILGAEMSQSAKGIEVPMNDDLPERGGRPILRDPNRIFEQPFTHNAICIVIERCCRGIQIPVPALPHRRRTSVDHVEPCGQALFQQEFIGDIVAPLAIAASIFLVPTFLGVSPSQSFVLNIADMKS